MPENVPLYADGGGGGGGWMGCSQVSFATPAFEVASTVTPARSAEVGSGTV